MDTGPCGPGSSRGGKGQEPSVHPILVIGQRGWKRCQFASYGRHNPCLRPHQTDILLEVADGISHGVGILSHEYGAVGYFLAKFLQSVGM